MLQYAPGVRAAEELRPRPAPLHEPLHDPICIGRRHVSGEHQLHERLQVHGTPIVSRLQRRVWPLDNLARVAARRCVECRGLWLQGSARLLFCSRGAITHCTNWRAPLAPWCDPTEPDSLSIIPVPVPLDLGAAIIPVPVPLDLGAAIARIGGPVHMSPVVAHGPGPPLQELHAVAGTTDMCNDTCNDTCCLELCTAGRMAVDREFSSVGSDRPARRPSRIQQGCWTRRSWASPRASPT